MLCFARVVIYVLYVSIYKKGKFHPKTTMKALDGVGD